MGNYRDHSVKQNFAADADAAGVLTPRVRLDGYDANDGANLIKSMQKKWRKDFVSPLLDNWDVVTAGGMTATIDAGVLTIATGTGAGAYAELVSKETFLIPFRAVFGLQTGTRQAGQHLYIEAISVDPVTGLSDHTNSMAWDVGGAATTTVTQGVYETRNGGLRALASSASTIASTTTYSVLELAPSADDAWFYSRAMDSTSSASASYKRDQQIPNPNALYKLRIRALNAESWKAISAANSGGLIAVTSTAHGYATGDVVWVEQLAGVTDNGNAVRGLYTITVVDANTFTLNGSVFGGAYVNGSGRVARAIAPAAGTNFQLQFAACADYTELTAEITGSRGQGVSGNSLGVNVTGGAVTASSTTYYDETQTALAAGATYTGSTRDMGGASNSRTAGLAKFNAFVFSDQAGTMRIDVSRDGTTWRRATVDTAVAANTPTFLSVPVTARYHRVVHVNGATAQTVFLCQSSYTPA